jgi:hypothetical protein
MKLEFSPKELLVLLKHGSRMMSETQTMNLFKSKVILDKRIFAQSSAMANHGGDSLNYETSSKIYDALQSYRNEVFGAPLKDQK